jgi:alkylation response protein AidB-like acyl-CoA dehydrogenase
MPASNAHDPLDGALLDRLGQRASRYEADPGLLAEDLALLRNRGYLKIAVPVPLGGMGLTLPQVACAQRRLAYHAPAAALAVNAHHAWVGAAAGVHAGGDSSADWLLREAAHGRLFAGLRGVANDLLADPRVPTGPAATTTDADAYTDTATGMLSGRETPGTASPGWDWLGVRAVDDSEPRRPRILHAFIRRSDPGCRLARITAPGPPDDPFIAGVFGWGLPLDGELCYAIARRAFDLATERARRRRALDRDAHPAAADDGCPPGQRSLADAALRLESVRDQLDAVLHGWRERARASGAVSTLDPGGLWLIRLFTVRHVAAIGARRAAELSARADGETTGRIPA